MKYLVQILMFFLFSSKHNAQNLITNPSFEDIDSCYGQPAGIGFDVFQWSGCVGWSCPIASSSDLWCLNPIFGIIEPPSISGLGYQYPRTGENMAGLLMNDGVIFSYREFIQNELQETLQNNVTYKLIFYHSPLKTDCSINQFGVLASINQMYEPSKFYLNDFVLNGVSDANLFLGDTSTWNYCEIIFKANGGEKFIVIGNFQDSTNTTYSEPCDTSFWGNLSYAGNYFFVDDVSLTKLPTQLEIPNVFTPNDDGINDFFIPSIVNYPNWKITILNRWGNRIIVLDETNPIWYGDNTTEGVYFYRFECEELNKFEQGYISIIR